MNKLSIITAFLGGVKNRYMQYNPNRALVEKFGIARKVKQLDGLELCYPTDFEDMKLLKQLLGGVDYKLKPKQFDDEGNMSFGIKEYIEIPGLEYNRDIGILGFEIDVSFKRKGKRVKLRKIKQGKYPKKQAVTKEEIIEFLKKNLKLEVCVLTVPLKLNFFYSQDLLNKLRPKIDGVIIRRGHYGATYLPQVWEDLKNKEEFLSSLCQKAGLPAEDWQKSGLEVMTYQAEVIKSC